MQQVQNGDTIQVHYHGTLTSGEIFDSSKGRAPLEFEVGSGMVIPGFDNGVLGMTVGEKKTIHIPFMEAYGPKQAELIVEFPKAQFPPDLNPQIGMALTMNNGQGQQFQVIVVEVKEEVVVLDANHALAGQDLTFDLELVNIDSPSKIIMP